MSLREYVQQNLIRCNKENDADAHYYLGLSAVYGLEQMPDPESALSHYETGAACGSAKCRYGLAVMRKDDPAVQHELFCQAFDRLLHQANAGDSESQRMVSCYYLCSDRGVARDLDKAISWLRRSAEQNNAVAMFNLAGCYFKGECVEKDQDLAMEWLRKSAAEGYEKAAMMLKKLEK